MRIDIDDLEFGDGVLHLGRIFTGTSVEAWPDGGLREEMDFVDGYAHGWRREWTRQGVLIKERYISHGLEHGLSRTWHDNGRLASESHYQFGHRLTTARWSKAGVREPDFRLDPASKQYVRWQEDLLHAASRDA